MFKADRLWIITPSVCKLQLFTSKTVGYLNCMREMPHVNWLSSTSSVILLQIVMVCPGTHPVRNHEPLYTTNDSQLKKKKNQGPVARSLVSANCWLRGIKMYRFPWYLTLVSTNHASSNPGQES